MIKTLIITIFVLLLLIAGMNVYLYLTIPDYSLFQTKVSLSTEKFLENVPAAAQGNPLDEGVFSYDVTQQQAIFRILETNIQEQTMILKYIFPYELRDNIIIAKVDCSLRDSWVIGITAVAGDFKTEKNLASESLLTLAESDDTLQAICADEDCSLINKKCELIKQVN